MRWLRRIAIVLVARPLARIFTGADIVGRERLPLKGPAIVVANHASHVDTLLLLTIYPSKALDRVRPAAAADYFLKAARWPGSHATSSMWFRWRATRWRPARTSWPRRARRWRRATSC